MKIDNFEPRSYSANESEIIAEKQREKDIFTQFEDKRVKIGYYTSNYSGPKNKWGNSKNEKIGKIVQKRDNDGPTGQFIFLPKRARSKGHRITLGLYDGHWATITINEIEKIN